MILQNLSDRSYTLYCNQSITNGNQFTIDNNLILYYTLLTIYTRNLALVLMNTALCEQCNHTKNTTPLHYMSLSTCVV